MSLWILQRTVYPISAPQTDRIIGSAFPLITKTFLLAPPKGKCIYQTLETRNDNRVTGQTCRDPPQTRGRGQVFCIKISEANRIIGIIVHHNRKIGYVFGGRGLRHRERCTLTIHRNRYENRIIGRNFLKSPCLSALSNVRKIR